MKIDARVIIMEILVYCKRLNQNVERVISYPNATNITVYLSNQVVIGIDMGELVTRDLLDEVSRLLYYVPKTLISRLQKHFKNVKEVE